MEKETAVEWLFKQLWEEPKDKFTWNAILSKAKEMEKEQIIDSHTHGFSEGLPYGMSPTGYKFMSAEQYYNETFKQD
jgi:hypothetical protein